ncbi:MAG: thiamine pyrophosphate-dependent enzyme, partial [Mycobacteriales bacterium]
GEFHEVMNLAALGSLPVLFLCENNRYAMGTAVERSHAVTDLARRAGTYGIQAVRADGMDVREVERVVRRTADGVRQTGAPAFVELETYRFRAHSMSDPDLYRTKVEIEDWMERDPIARHTAWLRGRGMPEVRLAEIEAAVDDEVSAAVEFAEDGDWEPVGDLTRDVLTPEAVA